MFAVVTFLVVVALSLLIVRIGIIALTMTGLSQDIASFQALSAFTGTGFTTRETESVTEHPARRRIMRDLMLLGNLGFVTALATGVLSVASSTASGSPTPLLVLLLGTAILLLLASTRRFQRWVQRPIESSLAWLTDLELKDYADLLQLEGGYRIAEITIEAGSWMADRSLIELRLADEGIWVLGIRRQDGEYVGVPRPANKLRAGEVLVVYGLREGLEELSTREAGDQGDATHRQVALEVRRHGEDTPVGGESGGGGGGTGEAPGGREAAPSGGDQAEGGGGAVETGS